MKVNKKALDSIMDEVKKAQVAYHITGGDIQDEYTATYTTPAGKTITYRAKRDWGVRGLSYTITREEVSISDGHKVEIINRTHEWAR